ncbi:MAG: PadR family transcriptional regulator [Gemmatimonadota bacterium]
MKSDHLHGTLDVLILTALGRGPMHGFGVGKWLEEKGGAELRVDEGSLYPALYRLERKGLLEAEWGTSENNRRAKYYRLTREGERRVATGTAGWNAFSAAVGRVLAAGQEG